MSSHDTEKSAVNHSVIIANSLVGTQSVMLTPIILGDSIIITATA